MANFVTLSRCAEHFYLTGKNTVKGTTATLEFKKRGDESDRIILSDLRSFRKLGLVRSWCHIDAEIKRKHDWTEIFQAIATTQAQSIFTLKKETKKTRTLAFAEFPKIVKKNQETCLNCRRAPFIFIVSAAIPDSMTVLKFEWKAGTWAYPSFFMNSFHGSQQRWWW